MMINDSGNLSDAGIASIMEKTLAVLGQESHIHHRTIGSALMGNEREVGEVMRWRTGRN